MKLIIRGVLIMGLLSIFNCRALFHRVTTGDHNADKETVINKTIIEQIRPGVTSLGDLNEFFSGKESYRWTYRKPFRVTWAGKEYTVNVIRTYSQIEQYAPLEVENGTIYAWKEQRWLAVYMYNETIQFVQVTHDVRDEKGRAVTGPLQNYDESLLEIEKMNGLGCERRIYEVVSLGMKPIYPEDFEKYCRPLIIEE